MELDKILFNLRVCHVINNFVWVTYGFNPELYVISRRMPWSQSFGSNGRYGGGGGGSGGREEDLFSRNPSGESSLHMNGNSNRFHDSGNGVNYNNNNVGKDRSEDKGDNNYEQPRGGTTMDEKRIFQRNRNIYANR